MSDPFIYNPIKIVLTIVIAFLPAILYSIIIRYSEKFDRNPWGSIGQAFLWGATLSLVLVIIIRGFFRVEIFPNYDWASDEGRLRLIIICLITPVFAEILKPIGLFFVSGDILEAEDGLIFGAVIDEDLENELKITVIATGFDSSAKPVKPLYDDDDQDDKPKKASFFQRKDKEDEPEKPVPVAKAVPKQDFKAPAEKKDDEDDLDIPAFIRKKMM